MKLRFAISQELHPQDRDAGDQENDPGNSAEHVDLFDFSAGLNTIDKIASQAPVICCK